MVVLARRPLDNDLTTYAQGLGRPVSLVELDLADPAAIATRATELLATTDVDTLVSNAGPQVRHPAAEFPLNESDAVLNGNLRAVFDLCQRFGAPLLERGHGTVMSIASLTACQGGLYVPPTQRRRERSASSPRGATSGRREASMSTRSPGYMDTDLNESLLAGTVRSEQISVRIPAGRRGTSAAPRCSWPRRPPTTSTA
ncbi:SDR family NAD(P)-dependent oxidoreductase [Streptomyces sp. NPDC059092]|uniref:SDR family NAD(P)-dependent oxidoreductase n=1 Tax=Streptomyces sp. NPDC059092 TaxID=3346725 RepID=UPI0036A1C30A